MFRGKILFVCALCAHKKSGTEEGEREERRTKTAYSVSKSLSNATRINSPLKSTPSFSNSPLTAFPTVALVQPKE